MRPVRVTVGSATISAPIPLDRRVPPTNVTLQLIVTGTNTSSLQYTTDDVQTATYNPATGNWFDLPGGTGLSASARVALTFPVTAVRLNVTAWTSGSAELDVLQSGP